MNTVPNPCTDLIKAADALHEACSGNDRLVASDQWKFLGHILDMMEPLPFMRNTGEPRILDQPLPLDA